MWQRFLIWTYGWLAKFASKFLYRSVSRLWRWLFEKKYKQMPIGIPWTIDQILIFFKECKWVQDPWGGTIDVISKPEKFYQTKQGDCDEYAAFACTVLLWRSIFLSVQWFDPKKKGFGKFQGHNVCVYFYGRKWWHIGNWGKRGPYETLLGLIKDVSPEGTILCNYSLRKADTLKVVATESLKLK